MATTTTLKAWPAAAHPLAIRFGREVSAAGEGAVDWVMRRRSSLSPRQVLGLYASLCAISLGIAVAFWIKGVTMVLPFAGVELLAVGVALLVHARHATDRESISLRDHELSVVHASGRRVERVVFQPGWVRVEPVHGDRSLIELSGQGRRIAVGRFVRPELRRQLADELRWALRRWQLRSTRTAT